MKILHYPHLTLRHKARPIRRVDRQLRETVSQMFELMYAARGIGLAGNQVDLPLQLFVLNLAGEKGAGTEQVFLNPVLSAPRGRSEQEEGCLSLPGINAVIARPESVHVTAWDLSGNVFDQRVDGMLARCIQHEMDHLEGVLFIDRLNEHDLRTLGHELQELEMELENQRLRELIPQDVVIRKRLAELESQYC